MVLLDLLGDTVLVVMIACCLNHCHTVLSCNPSSLHVEETLSTLTYTKKAKSIQNSLIKIHFFCTHLQSELCPCRGDAQHTELRHKSQEHSEISNHSHIISTLICSPSSAHVEEKLSTLSLAILAKHLPTSATPLASLYAYTQSVRSPC